MKSLFRKELRGLLPVWALVLLIFGSNLVLVPLTERLDELAWVDSNDQLIEDTDIYGYLFLLLALVAAYSVFPREHDERTIELLYALPISRRNIFATKALAAFTVVASGSVMDQVLSFLFQTPNTQSFSGEQWRLGVALASLFVNTAFVGIILCHGLLLSFLRRLGIIVYVVLAYAVQLVCERFPNLAFLKVTELVVFQYQGQALILPWRGLLFHAAVALFAFALAYPLWMGGGETVTRLYRKAQARPAGRFALGCATVSTVVLVVGGTAALLDFDEISDEADVEYPTYATALAETVHYTFTYPSNLSQRAHRLIPVADAAYEAVADALNASARPHIIAELTQLAGHAGLQQAGVIRLGLGDGDDHDKVVRTLHHETVHAFQHHLSRGRLSDAMSSARFFIEGLAEYLALQLVPDADLRRGQRQVAVAAWERHDVRFVDLVDDDAFQAVFDGNLVYALGETFAAAVVEACGPRAPGELLRALGRDDAPENLSGRELWQDTLQATGCDLEVVLAAWGAEMERQVTLEGDLLNRLPRLGGGFVATEDDELVFRLSLDRPPLVEGLDYYIRLRRDSSVPDSEIHDRFATLPADHDHVTFRVPRSWFAGAAFEFQLGQDVPGADWPFFELWQTAAPPQ